MFRCMLNYIRRQWIARPLAVFSVCFLAGTLLGTCVNMPLAFAAALPIFTLALHRFAKYRLNKRWFILPILTALLLGNARIAAELQLNPIVPERFSIDFSGTVISEPYLNESTERIVCEFRISEMEGVPTSYNVRLYLRSDELELTGIEYGQHLDCFGHVWPQEPATNPYEYDALNALRADGLDGMAAAKLEDVTITPSEPSLGRLRVRIRQSISDRIDQLFPSNADLVRAFVLGDRNDLDQEMRAAFNQTGVSHLICISGLHISTVAMAVSKLLSLRFTRKASALGTLIAVLLYGFLIGFPASLVRATVMFAVYSFAPVAGRPSDPITRLCAALLLMVMHAPFCVYDGGFVLSFAASAGILLLTEPLECLFHVDGLRRMKPHPRRLLRLFQRAIRYFPLLLCTTLAAQLATLPAVIAYFGAQPLISIPVNLVAIPIAMTAYPISLIALLLSVILPPLGQFASMLSDSMFSLLTWLIDFFASFPSSALRSPNYPGWLLAVHCLLILSASGLNRISIRIRRFLPLGLILLVGVSMLNAWINALGCTAVFLNAGQADAAVIKAEGRVYLYDTGDLYSPAADYVTGGCLGVDAVFLSHPHYDHAAGLAELIEELPPKIIYVPEGWFDIDAAESVNTAVEAAQAKGIPIVELSAGDELALSENVSARVYASADPSNSVNDLSMLLEILYYDSSLFYTGDLSAECEPSILPDVDILKVPHHGSATATSAHFVEQTSPKIAIVSVGENSYGHPSDEVLQRLKNAGATVYRTDQCGAIEVSITPSGDISVETYLPQEAAK